MKTSRGSMARRTRIGRATVISLSAVGALGVAVAVGAQGTPSAHASDDGGSNVDGATTRGHAHSRDGEREGQARQHFSAPLGKAPSQGATAKAAPHASSSGS